MTVHCGSASLCFSVRPLMDVDAVVLLVCGSLDRVRLAGLDSKARGVSTCVAPCVVVSGG